MTQTNHQPIAPIEPVIDNYFGTDVVDNYRYMENFNDPTVQQWVKAQAEYTIETLSQLPRRNTFFDRMMELIELHIAKLAAVIQHTAEWIKLCDADDEVRDFVTHENDIYLLTSKNAPRFKIIRTSLAQPDLATAETVLAESDSIVRDMLAANDAFYAIVTERGIGKIIRITYDGKIDRIELPYDGAVLFSKNDRHADGFILVITAWTKYYCIYQYNPATNLFTDLGLQSKGKYDAPEDLISTEVTVKSHDGTMVPLSIIHKKGIPLDGSNPCWLSGYGAYGFSILKQHLNLV